MTKVTKEKPRMWGTSIVGFGVHHYKYESGREGETCLVGFSSRKGDISVYGVSSSPDHAALLSQLGKHKMGKGCLYIRKMNEVNQTVLGATDCGVSCRKTTSRRLVWFASTIPSPRFAVSARILPKQDLAVC
jgi:hypothetical protein